MSSLYLVRHGQASFGSDDYDRLSSLGEEQARITAELFARLEGGITRLWCGTLARQRRTAEIIAPHAAVESDARWNELDVDLQIAKFLPAAGREAGGKLSTKAYQQLIKKAFEHWRQLPESSEPVSYETWRQFAARVADALRAAMQASGGGANVVVVSSGAVIATVAQQVLGLPPAAAYPLFEAMTNASITKLLFSGDRVSLVSFNDSSYLALRGARFVTHR